MPAHGAGLPNTGCPGPLLAVGTRGEVSAEGERVSGPKGNAALEPGVSPRQEER